MLVASEAGEAAGRFHIVIEGFESRISLRLQHAKLYSKVAWITKAAILSQILGTAYLYDGKHIAFRPMLRAIRLCNAWRALNVVACLGMNDRYQT
jgi:hypothetical protein